MTNVVAHLPARDRSLEDHLREAQQYVANDTDRIRNAQVETALTFKLSALILALNQLPTAKLAAMQYQKIDSRGIMHAEANKTAMLTAVMPNGEAAAKALLEKVYYMWELALVAAEKRFGLEHHKEFLASEPIVEKVNSGSKVAVAADPTFQSTHIKHLSRYEQVAIEAFLTSLRFFTTHAQLPEPTLRQFLQAVLLYKKISQ